MSATGSGDGRVKVGSALDVFDLATMRFTNPWVSLTKCAELLMTTRGDLYMKVYEFRICGCRPGDKDVLLYLPDLIRYITSPGNRIGGTADDIGVIDGLLRLQGAPESKT